jgi:hypothetical protein
MANGEKNVNLEYREKPVYSTQIDRLLGIYANIPILNI